jgi:hypothetical protein
MVRQIKSNCCSRSRTRTEITTFKRAGNQLTADKESKLTIIRTNIKNEDQHQRDAAIECEL